MRSQNLEPQVQAAKVCGLPSTVEQLHCQIAHHRVRGVHSLSHDPVSVIPVHVDAALCVVCARPRVQDRERTVGVPVVTDDPALDLLDA
eukprot:scaffold7510_cov74-Phaeocystis_antarctica.AAC.1